MNNSILALIGPLGTTEVVVIAILVLILFGAKKLPMFARSLGKSMGEFKKAKEEFESELHRSIEETSTTPSVKTPVEKREPVSQDV